MNKKVVYIVIGVILLITLGMFLIKMVNKPQGNSSEDKAVEGGNKFAIVSTNPDPLNESTILPSQGVEITFSKPLSVSEFKYKVEPNFEHIVEATGAGSSKDFGATFVITPKEALELGSGFTLFISGETQSADKESLGGEHIYHINTLRYKGN